MLIDGFQKARASCTWVQVERSIHPPELNRDTVSLGPTNRDISCLIVRDKVNLRGPVPTEKLMVSSRLGSQRNGALSPVPFH